MTRGGSVETVATTQATILRSVRPLGSERLHLCLCLGRVLAKAVIAERVVPAFANSSMDGYAVRAAELHGASREAPVHLPVDGAIAAGSTASAVLARGTALRIATGAPVPGGADAVVPHEQTDRGDLVVAIHAAVEEGSFVRSAGHDMVPGTVVVAAGRRLRPGDLAACAAAGVSHVDVARRPRVAILSTGDELVPVGTAPRIGQAVDSNAVLLAAAVTDAGGDPVALGIVGDTPDELREVLCGAVGCDLIISSGGVSVGDHDHVRDVVVGLGAVDLWRVAMRPGKPVAVGRVGDTLFLGLPGNPVSSCVTFELFARPAILALQGASTPHRRRFAATLADDISAPAHLETYVRAVFEPGPHSLPTVHATESQDSSALLSLARADCLIVIPAESTAVTAGSIVAVIPLP